VNLHFETKDESEFNQPLTRIACDRHVKCGGENVRRYKVHLRGGEALAPSPPPKWRMKDVGNVVEKIPEAARLDRTAGQFTVDGVENHESQRAKQSGGEGSIVKQSRSSKAER
jgi:hypothetical protein